MMRIINYQGVEQLAVFVTEQSEVEMHLSQNKNVIFLKGTTLYLFQKLEVSKYLISNENCTLQNGDVVLILKNGRIQKEFSASIASQTIVTTNQCNSNCIMCPASSIVRKNDPIENISTLLICAIFTRSYQTSCCYWGRTDTCSTGIFFYDVRYKKPIFGYTMSVAYQWTNICN